MVIAPLLLRLGSSAIIVASPLTAHTFVIGSLVDKLSSTYPYPHMSSVFLIRSLSYILVSLLFSFLSHSFCFISPCSTMALLLMTFSFFSGRSVMSDSL